MIENQEKEVFLLLFILLFEKMILLEQDGVRSALQRD